MEMLMMIKQGLVSPDSVNPITEYFHVGQRVASAGPDLVWKIYNATRISDNKVALRLYSLRVTIIAAVVELTNKIYHVHFIRTDK